MSLITTSASTVTTVKYLSLYELEQYKKQFQSFWIPFMEQFIPATTIWVAGERWCNEPCPVINVCDYDYELVASATSVTQILGIQGSGRTYTGVYTTPRLTANTSTATSLGTPIGSLPPRTATLTPVIDLGSTTLRPIIRTTAEASIDISSYRTRFTSLTTEIVATTL